MSILMIIICVLSIPVLGFMSLLTIWALAKNDWFWTIVEEGQAKVVLVNGAFDRILMAYQNKIFAVQDPHIYYVDADLEREFRNLDKVNRDKSKQKLREVNKTRIVSKKIPVGWVNHPWDIVFNKNNLETTKPIIPFVRFSSNIRWIGIPPFSQLYSYRFRWTSIEERADKEKEQTKKVPYTTEKVIPYINLKPDIFLITVTTAETNELVPLDIKLAVTAQVINPYKALFDAEKWLENVENQVGAKVRKFVGKNSYEDFIKAVGQTRGSNPKKERFLSNENLEHIIDTIKEEYGICISRVQILDVNPGSSKAEDFIAASTQKYVKAEKAKGDMKEAEGFEKKYRSISKFQEGPEMYKMEQVKDSRLRVYSSSNRSQGVLPTVTVEDVTKENEIDEK